MDPLQSANSPALLSACTDVASAYPEPDRTAALAAIRDGLISATFLHERGIDGEPIVVLEIGWFDGDGAHVLARFDAARFGWHYRDGTLTYTGDPA